MCVGSSPSAPSTPAKLPEAARLPETTAGGGPSDARRRAKARGTGSTSTILTGARGVQNGGATAAKTLLGQ